VAADVRVLRARRERVDSEHVRADAEAKLQQVRNAAERIRQMTRLYKERQDGRVQRS
jgi:hypothetical protein